MSEDSEKILSESLHAMAQDIKERDAEIERLRERITNALDALNDGDSSGAALILYETVRKNE
jgi:hypothetical protein